MRCPLAARGPAGPYRVRLAWRANIATGPCHRCSAPRRGHASRSNGSRRSCANTGPCCLAAERWARQKGLDEVRLTVEAFYEWLGFALLAQGLGTRLNAAGPAGEGRKDATQARP